MIPEDIDICISLDIDELLLPGWREKLLGLWESNTTRLSYNFSVGSDANGGPTKIFRKSKIHSRFGYRWKRAVHEDLTFTGSAEVHAHTDDILISHIQDESKSRAKYLPLMRLAFKEDPTDAQVCFWFARELMHYGENKGAIERFFQNLALPWSWQDERSEAMRYLAKLESQSAHSWLQKALSIAGHRRELWLDLSEYYHSKLDWISLFWSCSEALTKCRRTGSYLDDLSAWNFRIDDLLALACSHLGMIEKAVEHGTKALKNRPTDERLRNNLTFYRSQLESLGRKLLRQSHEIRSKQNEPPRVCRRPFGLSYAAMADCSSMA